MKKHLYAIGGLFLVFCMLPFLVFALLFDSIVIAFRESYKWLKDNGCPLLADWKDEVKLRIKRMKHD